MLKHTRFLSTLVSISILLSVLGNMVFAENNEIGIDSYVEIENSQPEENNIQEEIETIETSANNESGNEIYDDYDTEVIDENTNTELFSNDLQLFSSGNWSSDWKKWSQGSSENATMRGYGCWVVAQSKVLVMAGVVTPGNFNPDIFLGWEKSHGYINSQFQQLQSGKGAQAYAQSLGRNLILVGESTNVSNANIMNLVNQGYFIIARVLGNGHYVTVANDESKAAGSVKFYDSYKDHTEAPLVPYSTYANNITMIWLYRGDGKAPAPYVHTHNYSVTEYEQAHPHKVYRKCSCGAYEYTGETKKLSSCNQCYNNNIGSFNFKASYGNTYIDFSWSGASKATNFVLEVYKDGTYLNTYNTTNYSYRLDNLKGGKYTAYLTAKNSTNSLKSKPLDMQVKGHTHSFVTRTNNAHPHQKYRYCSSCGEVEWLNEYGTSASCQMCYPLGDIKLNNIKKGYSSESNVEFSWLRVVNATNYIIEFYKDNKIYKTYNKSNLDFSEKIDNGIYTVRFTASNSNTGQKKSTTAQIRVVDCLEPELNSNGEYEIYNEKNLLWVSMQCDKNNSFSDKTFRIMNDINLTGDWIPIAYQEDTEFRGNIEGDGYTISNLNVPASEKYTKAGLVANMPFGTIKNLNIKSTNGIYATQYAGALVGYGGTYFYVGYIAYAGGSGAEIRNCTSDADIYVTAATNETLKNGAGGIAGAHAHIYDCESRGNVYVKSAGRAFAGGLVGLLSSHKVVQSDSYANVIAEVSAKSGNYADAYAGGLAGYTQQSTINNCYAMGTVASKAKVSGGSAYTGGIVGAHDNGAVVTKSYYSGDGITADGTSKSQKDGIVGYISDTGFVRYSYFNKDTTNINSSENGTAAATSSMKEQSTYDKWNFTSIWALDSSVNSGYPYLTHSKEVVTIQATEVEPDEYGEYQITSAGELKWIAEQVNGGNTFEGQTIRLMNDIDLSGESWTPIGKGAISSTINMTPKGNTFSGTFTGNCHTIKGLYIEPTERILTAGLFGMAKNAVIKNVNVELDDIFSYYGSSNYSAGICAYSEDSTISNCHVTGSISAYSNSSGHDGQKTCMAGIAAHANGTTISDCSFNGEMYPAAEKLNAGSAESTFSTLPLYIGGIVGYVYPRNCTKVENCSASITNDIKAAAPSAYIGGLAGLVGDCNEDGKNTTIKNCSYKGNLKINFISPDDILNRYVGGLIGVVQKYNYDGYNISEVINCSVSNGKVEVSEASDTIQWTYQFVGGLIGANGGDVQYCHSENEVISRSSNSSDELTLRTGGLIGSNSGAITCCYATQGASGYTEGSKNKLDKHTKKTISYSGGLIGYTTGNVVNSYATGDAHATSYCDLNLKSLTGTSYAQATAYAGGLIGATEGTVGIQSCYATGKVSTYTYANSLYGAEYTTSKKSGITTLVGSATCLRSYVDKEKTGISSGTDGAYKSTSQMQTQITYDGWDFDNIWQMEEGSYPTLREYADSSSSDADFSDFEFDMKTGTITGYKGTGASVNIPEEIAGVEVSSIADNAFEGLSIKSVFIPRHIATIGSGAFKDCNLLTRVVFGDGVQTVGESAFSGCISLAKLEFNDKLQEIGALAFNECNKLNTITIPDSVSVIGKGAFSNCTELSKIEIGTGLEELPNEIFMADVSLTNVTLAENIKKIGQKSFFGCSKLAQIDLSDTAIEELAGEIFSGCTSLKNISLPSTLNHIGEKSFFGCIGLEEFIVPENVTVIDGFAFMNCTNLQYITIPDAVSAISLDTFNNCRTINIKCYDESYAKQYAIDNYIPYEILIPEAVDIKKFKLTGDAITECRQSEDLLVIPNEVNINDVELENDSQVVQLMSADEEIKINTIGASAFEDNTNIVSLSIDDGIETIEDAAFRDCTDMKFADIPESITDIADNAFDGCDNLIILCAEGSVAEEYAIENNIEYVINKVSADGEWEYDETTGTITKYLGNGTDVVIPYEIDGVQITSIGSNAFENNDTIEKILIPYTVVSVGENAFAGCSNLKEATIGYGVELIEDNAFAGCDGLNLIFDGTVENISDMAFNNDNITFSIYYCDEGMYDYTQNHDIEIIWLNSFEDIEDEKTIEMSMSKDDNGDYIITISNTTENKSSGVLCLAEYDENSVLLNIQSQNIEIPTDTFIMNFTSVNSSAKIIKCFLWNDFKNMQPICSSVEW